MDSPAGFGAAFVAVALCGCVTDRHAAAQAALDSCIDDVAQSGWTYLPQAPANADELRGAMRKSGQAHLVQPEDQEYWFSHNDGRVLRCTLHPQFVDPGAPALCGAFTSIFTPREGAWTVEHGPLIMCHVKAKP